MDTLTPNMLAWLRAANSWGILPERYPNGPLVEYKTIHAIERATGYVRFRSDKGRAWAEITRAGREFLERLS